MIYMRIYYLSLWHMQPCIHCICSHPVPICHINWGLLLMTVMSNSRIR